MKRILVASLLLASTLGAQALRMPMDGRFGMSHVLSEKNKTSRLDSIKVYGEWGGWVDSSSFFHYDAQNRLMAAEGYNGNNALSSTVSVIYNPDGSYTLTETLLYDAKNPYLIYTYRYAKDKKLQSVTQYAVESQKTSTTELTYRSSKGRETVVCMSIDGGENSTTTYDSNGRLVSKDFGTVSLNYVYDKKGNLVQVEQQTVNSKNPVSSTKYEYDASGNPVRVVNFSASRSQDSVVSLCQFNADRQMIRRKIDKNFVDYTYTANGDVYMETRVENDNIYGAKNKVYFYNNIAKKSLAKGGYDLSKYPAGSAVANYGKLCVKNSKLCDQFGNPVQLRGISTHGVQWFTNIYTNPQAINSMVDNWNINVLRVAMYVQESGYATGEVKSEKEWNTYIDSIASLCEKKGIYCIIDWHVLTPGDPLADANFKMATDFWNYMSAKHAGDAHVLYEICNEPNGGDVSWPRVREYGRRMIGEIRKNDPSTVVLVGTPVWSQDVDVAALAQIEDADVMYSLHFYSGSHGKTFRQRGDRAMAAPYHMPIFITEFGTSDASGDNGFFKDATMKWLSWARDNNLSWCNWSFADKGESASLLKKGDAQNGIWDDPTEAGMLIRCVLRDPSLSSVDSCAVGLNNVNY